MDKKGMFKKINKAIMEGEADETVKLVKTIIGEIDPLEIVNEGMTPAMKTVGEKFGSGEIFLPEMLQATEAWNEAMKILKPKILEKGKTLTKAGTVVIGTVQTDIHEIGKNIVGIMLETAGYQVIDLGMEVEAEAFVKAAKDNDAAVIGASALLTTTMEHQKEIVELAHAAGLKAKVIVGGAPVTQEWATQIGADGYAEDAKDAVKLVDTLLQRAKGRGDT